MRLRWLLAVLAAPSLGAAGLGACVSIDGLVGGADAGHDAGREATVLQFDAGRDVRADRSASVDSGKDVTMHEASLTKDGGRDADAELDAPVCMPVATSVVSYEGGSCPTPDGSLDGACFPVAPSPASLAWVPPHAHISACTASELMMIGSSYSPAVSSQCASCFFSLTTDTSYGAEVDYPQITFTGYGFANVAGCLATVEPCNTACAMLQQEEDFCATKSCLPNCLPDSGGPSYTDFIDCQEKATGGCPCAAITLAAEECFTDILNRDSPGAACIGVRTPGQTMEEAYLAELQAVTTVLCGMVDGG